MTRPIFSFRHVCQILAIYPEAEPGDKNLEGRPEKNLARLKNSHPPSCLRITHQSNRLARPVAYERPTSRDKPIESRSDWRPFARTWTSDSKFLSVESEESEREVTCSLVRKKFQSQTDSVQFPTCEVVFPSISSWFERALLKGLKWRGRKMLPGIIERLGPLTISN